MDSLIVLRKPLKKPTHSRHLDSKCVIPKKAKKSVAKPGPSPSNITSRENSNEAPISFVQLYNDLCVENSQTSATNVRRNSPTRVHVNEPVRALIKHMQLHETYSGCRHENSIASAHSDSSLVTQYRGRFSTDHRVYAETSHSSSAQPELILELDYNSNSKDSGFY